MLADNLEQNIRATKYIRNQSYCRCLFNFRRVDVEYKYGEIIDFKKEFPFNITALVVVSRLS